MLTIAKYVAHGSFGFNTEIVVRTMVFVKKIPIGHTISVRNTMEQRQFRSETEVCGAMDASGLSQTRDLAKVDDFEILSL